MGHGGGGREGKINYNYFKCPPPHLASAPILYQSSIQDGSIENPIYYQFISVFCSKITGVYPAGGGGGGWQREAGAFVVPFRVLSQKKRVT